jgi:hypothetical protein
VVSVVGEAGLIRWSTTVFFTGSPPEEWSEAIFVAGQPYTLRAERTDAGRLALVESAVLEQSVGESAEQPLAGLEETEGASASDLPDVVVTFPGPGDFFLLATADEEVVDATTISVQSGRVEVADGVVYGDPSGRW